MGHPRFSADELGRRGHELYEQGIRTKVETPANIGKNDYWQSNLLHPFFKNIPCTALFPRHEEFFEKSGKAGEMRVLG